LKHLVGALASSDEHIGAAVCAELPTGALGGVALSLYAVHFREDEHHATLDALMTRVKTASDERNQIAHSFWDGFGSPLLDSSPLPADGVVRIKITAKQKDGTLQWKRQSLSPADLDAMARRTLEAFGRIDILVNNAGIYRAALPHEVTEEHWDAVLNINAKAVFFASKAVLGTMRAQRSGNIISLASMAAKVGSRTNLPYNASKAAVVSMTKSLALAHAADGIRVNCVCPGFVETDMWTMVAREQSALLNLSPEEFTQRRLETVPLGRMERPEDVANVIGFLASPRAAYMTGQALSVDGGLVMHG
jgi:NAD(P)-dependent dehydrogenase (short-subunit alcohol dehydrogenase family)